MAFCLSIVLFVFCTVRKVTNLQLYVKANRKYVQYKPFSYYFVEDELLFFIECVYNVVSLTFV